MCTGLSLNNYFGRNFDYEISYNEQVAISPRNYEFQFKNIDSIKTHNAIIGIAVGGMDYPLYYDAYNEKGLGMAGLNFPDYAEYSSEIVDGKVNLAEFELIPYVLSNAENVSEAKKLFDNINITDQSFSKEFPISSLHWMVADKSGASFTVESTADGIKITDNPVGVLTNSPTFDLQIFNLKNYIKLSNKNPEYTFLDCGEYSRGMGGMGLPGDFSSMSRFVKTVFVKNFSKDFISLSQFFHILNSVAQPRGSTEVEEGKYEYTIYSSCMDFDKNIFHYKTYDEISINSVDFNNYISSDKDNIIYIQFE